MQRDGKSLQGAVAYGRVTPYGSRYPTDCQVLSRYSLKTKELH